VVAMLACWESRGSRATIGGISATWPQGGPETVCWDTAPCLDQNLGSPQTPGFSHGDKASNTGVC
jgi:hypothetical protein